MLLSLQFSVLLALIPVAVSQQPVYAQCGGTGWTGGTACAAGSTCVVSNPYYSQCLPESSSVSSAPSQSSSVPSQSSSASFPGSTSTVAGLNAVAKGVGKLYFGTATDNPELTDTAYTAILDNNQQFGQLTPANSMKWDATEPTQGDFTFTEGDQIVALANSNGQIMRGHNCVWYNQLPSWVTDSNFTAEQLTSVIQTHCGTLVSHYKGEIDAWDVVNEPFNDDGTWRTDVFYDTLNTTYVPIALQAARAADPNAKIYINEYNLEYPGPKATSMLNLIQQLKADNVPIDGLGLQGHLIVGQVPTTIQSQLEEFAALGIEVAITELDIRMTLPETDALLAQQKTDYETVISACNAVSSCVGVTLWDFTDKYSWVPSTFSGQGAACPWDENLVKKPAFDGIVIGFQ